MQFANDITPLTLASRSTLFAWQKSARVSIRESATLELKNRTEFSRIEDLKSEIEGLNEDVKDNEDEIERVEGDLEAATAKLSNIKSLIESADTSLDAIEEIKELLKD